MLRNHRRLLAALGAALFAGAPAALHAQSGQPVRGDVDGDGRVTAADARIVSDFLVGRPVPPGVDVRRRGDVNGDGRLTAADAAIISRAAAGRDVSRFPVGRAIPDAALAVLECTGSVRMARVECRSPGAPATGARTDIIVGGQHENVTLTSADVQVNDSIFQFTVTVQNLLAQAMAADSGTGAPAATGVQVFFDNGPFATGSPGTITVDNPDGTGMFLAANQHYFQYAGSDLGGDGILSPNEISSPRTWRLKYSTADPVNFTFTFRLYLNTEMQFPFGWVDIHPPSHAPSPYIIHSDTVQVGATLQLQDTVRNAFGGDTLLAVTWSNTANGHATVSPTGVVSGVSAGVDSVIAASGPRSGRVQIVVAALSADSTTITPSHDTIPANDTSLITVQVRDQFGRNATIGGATVILDTDLGTLVTESSSGVSVTADDNGNGTYTAKLTHTGTGTAIISGTLDGNAIGDSATVVITSGTPANMVKSAGDAETATVNTATAIAPEVTITDAHGNPVAGVSVTFTVTGGGGSVTGSPAVTNAAGVAAAGSWTLGTTAGPNTLDASAPGLTTVTFTATGEPGAPANITKNAGDAQSAVVNTNVAVAPQVKITDSFNNPVPNVSVTFSPASGGGSVTGSPAMTDAAGLATVGSWQLGTTVGSNTLTATAGALDVTFTATGTPDVPANIAITSTNPQNGTVGAAVASAPAVHVTDQYGNATPGITVNFTITGGGGSLTGGAPVTDASGNAAVGSWTLGGTGPGPNTLSATASGGSNPDTVFIAYVPPVVGADSSQAMGNTTLGSSIAPNVLANDQGLNGAALAISTTGALTTVRGGTLTLAPEGTFTYLPPAGNVLRDSVQYTVGDGHLSASAYIKLRFVGKVWYVDNTFAGTADGRDVSPYTSVAAAQAVAGVNDSILVRTGSGTTSGGTLKNGQLLRGQGHNSAFTTTLNGQSVTLLATGTSPNVGALTLGSGNSLRGLRIFNAAGGGLTGAGIGTLSLGEISIGVTGGPALDLSNGTVTGNGGTGVAALDSLRSTNSSTSGVSLATIAGTLTINGGTASSITGPTGTAVNISGGSVAFTFPGTVSKTNAAGTGINLSTSGNVSFTGPSIVLNTGAGTGINLSNASGTVSFVDSVKVNTTSGAGISAANSGTLTITGTRNSISTGTGTALNVSNTTIGAAGLTFRSISASGGANGIVLSSTGTTGGLTVTGDGATNGSGGTITNTTGADGATSGNGIYLNGTRFVNLSWMALSGHANNGLYGTGVRGLTMNKMRFTGNNGTSNSGTFDESPVNLVDLGGAVKVTNSRFDGGAYNAFRVENTAGTAPTLDSLVLAFDTVTTMQGSTSDVRGTAILVTLSDGTADTRIRNNHVTAWWGNAIHVLAQGTASGVTRITNNFADNTNGALAGAGGIAVVGGNHQYNISSNTVRHTNGTAISADRVNFGTTMQGTIDGNTIGVSGDNNSGSVAGNAVFASHHGPGTTTTRISNNIIRQAQAASGTGAIWILTGDAAGFAGSGTLNATVTGNDIQESGTPTINAHSGILVTVGTQSGPPNDTDQTCLDIGGSTAALRNTIANFNTAAGAGGQNRIRVNQRFGTTSRFPGYTGTQLGVSSQTDLASYLLGRNTASNSTNANTSTGGFNNTSPAGSACPQPSL